MPAFTFYFKTRARKEVLFNFDAPTTKRALAIGAEMIRDFKSRPWRLLLADLRNRRWTPWREVARSAAP